MVLALLHCFVLRFLSWAEGSKTIKRLRMIDHMMIYVVIAGGYTPVATFVLPTRRALCAV